jgi:RTX calcium-binding nonapeptide repeat (4 copies)
MTMGTSRGASALIAALAASSALAAAASPADAARLKVSYPREHVRVQPGTSDRVVAKCPRGTHVQGGGVGMTYGSVLVKTSMPVDRADDDSKPDDGWSVTLHFPDSSGPPERAFAEAVCAGPMPRYVAGLTTATGELTTGLECPAGTKATGAGAATEGSLGTTFLRQWAPYGFGGAGGSATLVVVQGSAGAPGVSLAGVCTDKLRLRYPRRTFTITAPYGSPEPVQCKRRERVVGGGGYVAAPAAGIAIRTEDSFADDNRSDPDHRPDNAWGASFLDDPFGSEPEAKVVAVCGRPKAAAPASRRGQRRPRCFGERATVTAESGSPRINGTKRDDVIVGRKKADKIYGRGGDDLICGLGGKDVVYAGKGAGSDQVDGGKGNDRIWAGTSRSGSDSGDDFLVGGAGTNLLRGDGGNDVLRVGASDSGAGRGTARGGGGNDQVVGSDGKDNVRGEGGDDQVYGGEGVDRVLGGPGMDLCDGDWADAVGDGSTDTTDGTCETEVDIP